MLAGVEIYFQLRLHSDLQGIGSYAVAGTKVEKMFAWSVPGCGPYQELKLVELERVIGL